MEALSRSVILMSLLWLSSVAVVTVAARSSAAAAATFSSRLIHRFSGEMGAIRASDSGGDSRRPERGTTEYYRRLIGSDLERRRMAARGSKSHLLFPSEGSSTVMYGNDFGWLHYTWIDIGGPPVSYLVALDSGSDLLWVPCDCIQCAPLTASSYSSLDKNLNEYSVSRSNTSKKLSCSHQLCELGSNCQSSDQPCPYTVNYLSDNVSSSGFLVEDTLHLASAAGDASNISVPVSVVIGCGRKQSGLYLDGVAPDGLMGLGLGKISVPSFLSKAGLAQNSFSLCFNEDDSGRIFFGDEGLATQQSTPFLPLDGKYSTYVVGVDACCIGSICQEHTSFSALIDSGTSFTFFPVEVYEKVVKEFDRQVNATRSGNKGAPWDYCYNTNSQDFPKIPSVKFMFAPNNSFIVHNPVFRVYEKQGVIEFCLAIQRSDGDIGLIGQNFMMGYRMVFDREKLKLGWSPSNCTDLSNSKGMPLTPSPSSITSNPLPLHNRPAISPAAIAGKAPSKSSVASTRLPLPMFYLLVRSILLHLLAMIF